MSELSCISIGENIFDNDFYWDLYWGINGGFIGLKYHNKDYNIWSTKICLDFDKCKEIALKANKKILDNIDVFKKYILEIDHVHNTHLNKDSLYENLIPKIKELEKFIDE